MSVEIKAPLFPESIAEGTIASWNKKQGEAVKRDELLLEVETDKVVLEVSAPQDGVLKEIFKQEGATVLSEEKVGIFEIQATDKGIDKTQEKIIEKNQTTENIAIGKAEIRQQSDKAFGPAVRNIIDANQINLEAVQGSGKGGRILKEDVLDHLNQNNQANTREERVPMSRLRMSVARRLLSAQHDAAMLTTFNEVNMQPVMDLRVRYKEMFEKKHQSRLGFMSFFVKAAVEALKRFPDVNAFIDGNDIIYHAYQNIGVAVLSAEDDVAVSLDQCFELMGGVRDEFGVAGVGDEQKVRGRGRFGTLNIDDLVVVSNQGL